jgi:hypothetical protein
MKFGGDGHLMTGSPAATPENSFRSVRSSLAGAGLSFNDLKYKTHTDHIEAVIVRGTGYNADHLDQPRAGLPSTAYLKTNVLKDAYGYNCS